MTDEILWRILEKHYYASEEGYVKKSVYMIPWDKQAWLLSFSIHDDNYRAVIEKHRTAHIYILKQSKGAESEINMPESWFTDWDEGFSMGEFKEYAKEESE